MLTPTVLQYFVLFVAIYLQQVQVWPLKNSCCFISTSILPERAVCEAFLPKLRQTSSRSTIFTPFIPPWSSAHFYHPHLVLPVWPPYFLADIDVFTCLFYRYSNNIDHLSSLSFDYVVLFSSWMCNIIVTVSLILPTTGVLWFLAVASLQLFAKGNKAWMCFLNHVISCTESHEKHTSECDWEPWDKTQAEQLALCFNWLHLQWFYLRSVKLFWAGPIFPCQYFICLSNHVE